MVVSRLSRLQWRSTASAWIILQHTHPILPPFAAKTCGE
jgi:hypothetical protein